LDVDACDRRPLAEGRLSVKRWRFKMTDSNSISIIIPTLNEEENIAPLVSEISACAVPFREILFVDDHSVDETCDNVRALAVTTRSA
jgi:cellulose synthase/poly-beta-1,6-N-acetylglucosamine synthase-like glycosyltransferase